MGNTSMCAKNHLCFGCTRSDLNLTTNWVLNFRYTEEHIGSKALPLVQEGKALDKNDKTIIPKGEIMKYLICTSPNSLLHSLGLGIFETDGNTYYGSFTLLSFQTIIMSLPVQGLFNYRIKPGLFCLFIEY